MLCSKYRVYSIYYITVSIQDIPQSPKPETRNLEVFFPVFAFSNFRVYSVEMLGKLGFS